MRPIRCAVHLLCRRPRLFPLPLYIHSEERRWGTAGNRHDSSTWHVDALDFALRLEDIDQCASDFRAARCCRWSRAARASPSRTASSSGAFAGCRRRRHRSPASTPTSIDDAGALIPQVYHGRTRRERHEELVAYAIHGGISQARVAHETSGGRRPHPHERAVGNGGRRAHPARRAGGRQGPDPRRHLRRRHAVPDRRDRRPVRRLLLSDRLLGARLPRAVEARLPSSSADWLGGVVYEDPWLAGGHNGLSNCEDPDQPRAALSAGPSSCAGRCASSASTRRRSSWPAASGILREWEDWIDNPELGPIAFQFGTRPLLTQESPISDAWKRRLLTLEGATSTSTASARPASTPRPCTTAFCRNCGAHGAPGRLHATSRSASTPSLCRRRARPPRLSDARR